MCIGGAGEAKGETMTHAPLPPWVLRIKAMIAAELAVHGYPSVGVCWRPRKRRVDFSVTDVETGVSVVLEGLRRERNTTRGGRG